MFADKIYSDEKENFKDLEKYNEIFKSMPTDLLSVPFLDLKIDERKTLEEMNELSKLLKTKFDRMKISKEIKNEIESEKDFIKKGLEVLENSGNKLCPFCKQKFSKEANSIIDSYNKYFHDQESKVIDKLKEYNKKFEKLKEQIKQTYNEYMKIKDSYNENKKYVPSCIKIELSNLIEDKSVFESIDYIESIINQKTKDISRNKFEINELIITIENYLKSLENKINSNNILIKKLNKKINDRDKEKLDLNRRLCKSCYNELKQSQVNNINDVIKLKDDYEKLEIEIKEKESKSKISKKIKVANSFEKFLTLFLVININLIKINSLSNLEMWI